jgi:hypothetical protein
VFDLEKEEDRDVTTQRVNKRSALNNLGEMQMRSKKTLLKPSLILTIAALGFFSGVVFAAPPPKNTPHPCSVAVGDRVGDSILSDNGNTYSNGTTAEARLWDMVNGVADHLFFQVDPRRHQGRKIRLSIPTIAEFAGGPQDCQTATFKPNQNDDNYQFYNALPIGKTTDDPDIRRTSKGTSSAWTAAAATAGSSPIRLSASSSRTRESVRGRSPRMAESMDALPPCPR